MNHPQAFLQSMQKLQAQQTQAQQQQQQQQPGAMFAQLSAGNANGRGNASAAAIGGLRFDAAPTPNPEGLPPGQQFSRLFGNATAVQGPAATSQNLPLAPPPPPQGGALALQAQVQATGVPQTGKAQQQGNGTISQLMASLQTHQQAQQQAQQQAGVQATLARAFAPASNLGGSPNISGATGSAVPAPEDRGCRGGSNGLAGLRGLPSHPNVAVAQPPRSAKNLLSMMQTTSSAAALAVTDAGADEILKLQLEQQRHNQMIQVVQADRQERAMLANQNAMEKRRRKEAKKSGSAVPNESPVPARPVIVPPSEGDIKGASGDDKKNNAPHHVFDSTQEVSASSTLQATMKDAVKSIMAHQFPDANKAPASITQQVSMHDDMKGMMAQFPNTNATTLTAACASVGFPNTGLLTNANLAAQLGVGAKLPPGLMTNLTSALNQSLQGSLAQGPQTGLGQGLTQGLRTSLPDKLSMGAANPNTEQHFHQKLGAPCRARGMPVDHNFKTAYFVIPEGIEHGDELVCSYPACRQAGIKFRYCLHCKSPVAKRNFRNRHRHGVPGGSESEEEQGAVTCQPCPDSVGAKRPANEGGDEGADVQQEHLGVVSGAGQPWKNRRKRKKGYVRIPCRARGIPVAHNSKTAYFDIPPTVQHGDEVLCSFLTCRSAGVKFRYCLHCKVPVAKRNFRNRHRHGDLYDKVEGKEPGGPEEGEEEPRKTPVSPAEEDKRPVKREEGAPESVASSGPAGNQVSVNSWRGVAEVQKWVSLLENKPPAKDKHAMAVWMLNLMNAPGGGRGAPSASKPAGDAALVVDAALGEEDARLIASGLSQPPNKKFKQDMMQPPVSNMKRPPN